MKKNQIIEQAAQAEAPKVETSRRLELFRFGGFDYGFGAVWWFCDEVIAELKRDFVRRTDRKHHPSVSVLAKDDLSAMKIEIPFMIGSSHGMSDSLKIASLTPDKSFTYFSRNSKLTYTFLRWLEDHQQRARSPFQRRDSRRHLTQEECDRLADFIEERLQ